MRLDKYIADMSEFSRNDIKKLIRDKRIFVNDEIVKTSSIHVGENDIVKIDDVVITYVEFEYIMLNKPAGYLSATEDKFDPTVMELIDSVRSDLCIVGRLDKDTEGLLLITNDGQTNHKLLAKDNHVVKKYYVEVDKDLPNDAKEQFSKPMQFKEFTSKPAFYEQLDSRKAYLSISEGKFHQVKRMFEKIGCEVTYLKRVRFGKLELGDLPLGHFRYLTQEEIDYLLNVEEA